MFLKITTHNQMNRETRIFILGLLLCFVCGLALATTVIRMENGTWVGTNIDWVLFILNLLGGLIGLVYISKSI